MTQHAQIIGTGGYLPKKILSNHDLEKMVDTSDAWITARSGIRNRHIIDASQSVVDLAFEASKEAVKRADLKTLDVDLIVFATSTPERAFPSSACLLQNRLGIPHCIAFDINAACSGFVYALQVANLHIQTKMARTVLVVGSEAMSRIVDWSDRRTCVLFGDGAGAIVLQAADHAGILSTELHAEAQHHDLLYVSNDTHPAIQMQGNAVFKLAVQKLAASVAQTLNDHNITSEDLDWLIPHQANARIIRAIAEKIDLPIEKVVMTLEQHGNTSAASIPLALHHGIANGMIQKGQLLLLEGFGGGFTWGASLIRY